MRRDHLTRENNPIKKYWVNIRSVIMWLLAFSLFCASLTVLSSPVPKSPKYPVVLVPGDGGNQIEARLNKSQTVHWYCYKKSDWYTLWLSGLELEFIDCLVDNMRLIYDNVSRVTNNAEGVEIREPGFGNTSTVEWLDPVHPVFSTTFSYFYFLVDYLVTNMSYTRNVNIRGAPYDFRKAPNEMHDYIDRLVKLIEETYFLNGEQKVVVVGHSMGNLYVLYMLNRKPQDWKDKFIQSFVSLGGPWAGSVKPLRLMASGDSLGQSFHIIKPLEVRPLQRSLPSTAYLMPYDTYWTDKEVLVYAPTTNYTVMDYKRFFNDIGFPDGYLMREDTENLTKAMVPPGIEVHCLYGYNVATPNAFSYIGLKGEQSIDLKGEQRAYNWYDYQPDVIKGDGDGTVNIRSLEACQSWKGKQSARVVWQAFQNAEHVAMLRRDDIFSYIRNVLLN